MPSIILAARGRITTHHRQNIGRGFPHNGIDQGHGNQTTADLAIRAPASGMIAAAGRQGSYGNRLVIRHDDGWSTLLAHHAVQHVRVGQRVTQGQIVAVMGSTGTVFIHSHQELRRGDGAQVDPLKYVGTSASASANTPIVITALPEPKDPTLSTLERHPNGTIALASPDGSFIPLNTMDEINALIMTQAIEVPEKGDPWTTRPDGFVWQLRTAIAARKAAQGSSNPAEVARALAPLIIPAVLSGLSTTGAGLTEAQVTEAAEVAIRNVFADVVQ